MSATILFRGLSGNEYKFWFFDIDTELVTTGGNYGFVKRLPNGNFVPLYWGECQNFNTRFPNHERLGDAISLGATHVVGHTKPAGEQARKVEERDLIGFWNPPMNVQHRSVV